MTQDTYFSSKQVIENARIGYLFGFVFLSQLLEKMTGKLIKVPSQNFQPYVY